VAGIPGHTRLLNDGQAGVSHSKAMKPNWNGSARGKVSSKIKARLQRFEEPIQEFQKRSETKRDLYPAGLAWAKGLEFNNVGKGLRPAY